MELSLARNAAQAGFATRIATDRAGLTAKSRNEREKSGGETGIVRGCAAHPSLALGTAGARTRRRPSPPLRAGSANPIVHVRGFESLRTSIGRHRNIRGSSSEYWRREGFEPDSDPKSDQQVTDAESKLVPVDPPKTP